LTEIDTMVLLAETSRNPVTAFGHTVHPTIGPFLAPPDLLKPMRDFLEEFPFENNVFGMTRFPNEGQTNEGLLDALAPALALARAACASHGLVFHLASDRMIVDDLWPNVLAHMWASRYGLAFFEDIAGRGLNYNLTIEVGGMLMSGRRTALLKDQTVEQLPTDLVGKIYKPVRLTTPSTVRKAVHSWLRDDLSQGTCPDCKRSGN
jgi:hypothetical protein